MFLCNLCLKVSSAETELCVLFLRVTDVVHTVGPMARSHVGPTETNDLTSCYQNSLRLMKEHGLRTVVSSSHEHYLAAQTANKTETAKFCVNVGASEKCSENLETAQERDVFFFVAFFFPLRCKF